MGICDSASSQRIKKFRLIILKYFLLTDYTWTSYKEDLYGLHEEPFGPQGD